MLQRRDQGCDDPRARCANGVAKRGRAAMHVNLVMRDAKIVHCKHGDAGKGLVHFKQVHITDGPTRLFQAFVDRADGCSGECRWFLRMGGVGHDTGDGVLSVGIGDRLTRQDKRRRTIRDG